MRSLSVIHLTAVTAATLLAFSTRAQQVSAPSGTAAPAIVVTAARQAEPLEDVLAPVLVVTREELERTVAQDVTEVLRFHAGLDVVRSGGPGQPTSVFIRGAESNHTLVLVDGVRINPGTIGSAALQNIAPEHVERIEVVKGPRSTLYGSDAIGGVINIITRQGQVPGMRLALQAGGGAYTSRQGSAQAAYGSTQGSAGLHASWLESDGFPTRRGDVADRGFANRSLGAHARTRIGTVEAGIRHWQAEGNSEYSDFFLTPVDQDFLSRMTSLDFALAPVETWNSRLTVSRIEDRILQNQSPDRLRTVRHAVDWQNDFAAGPANHLTAGILHSEETAEAVSFGSGFTADTTVTSVYLQDRIRTGRHHLLLAAGHTEHTTFGGHATWNAEYGLDVTPRTRLIAAAGTGFRAPDATDRFGFGGNPDLDPETSRQVEISLRRQVSARQSLALTAFRNDIDDLIEYVILDFDTFDGQLRNVEEARIRGIELAWELAGDAWRLRAEASHQDPENLGTGEPLLRRARNSLTLGYVHTFGPLEVGLDVLGVDERRDFGPVTLDAYALANLTARYAVTRDWSLLARVENMFDEDYELASGYQTPDRGLFVAVRYAPQ